MLLRNAALIAPNGKSYELKEAEEMAVVCELHFTKDRSQLERMKIEVGTVPSTKGLSEYSIRSGATPY